MKTKSRLYGQAQIELHAKLKAKKPYKEGKPSTAKNKRRTKAEEKRLKELNNLANKRGFAPPQQIKARIKSGVPLPLASNRGYGVQLADLNSNGFAQTRALLACKWLVEQWSLDVYLPLDLIKERVFDPQRATAQATLIDHPPDGVAVENLPYVAINQDLLDIFFYKVGPYKVQISYKWLLYNENSREYTWMSIFSLSHEPKQIVGYINNTLLNFKNQGENANSEYGKYLIKVSAYVQMKGIIAFDEMMGRRKEAKAEKEKQKKEKFEPRRYKEEEIKIKKKSRTSKKGKT